MIFRSEGGETSHDFDKWPENEPASCSHPEVQQDRPDRFPAYPMDPPPITTGGGRSCRGACACVGRKLRKYRLEDLLASLQVVTHLPDVRVGDLHQHLVDRLLHGLPQDELLGVGQGDFHGLTSFESAEVFRCRPI